MVALNGGGWAGQLVTGGGNDPTVVLITNLNDSGPGSVRAFLEDDGNWGPRKARVLVSGRIRLRSQIFTKGDFDIDAREEGHALELTDYRIRIAEGNCTIRGLKMAIGNGANVATADNSDGISVGDQPNPVTQVLVEYCTIMWTGDEIAGSWGPNSYITFAHCVFGEPLRLFRHSEGAHGMGLLVGRRSTDPQPSKISILFNLFVSCDFRTPQLLDNPAEVEIIGNVVHNYGNTGLQVNSGQANIINNVFQQGANSSNISRAFRNGSGANIYHTGNKVKDGATYTDIGPESPGSGNISTTVLEFTGPTTAFPNAGQDVFDYVMTYAGHDVNDDHVLRLKQHAIQVVGAIINEPREMRDHTGQPIKDSAGGNNPTDQDAYDWKIPDEFKNGGGGAGPVQAERLTGSKGDGDHTTPLVIPNVPSGKNWRLRINQVNAKGAGPFSDGVIVSSNPVSAGATSPIIVGTSSNNQWRFNDIEDIVWPAGHLSGDYLLGVFSVKGNNDPTGNDWTTFLTGEAEAFDGVVVNEANAAGTNVDLHQGVGFKFANIAGEPNIVLRDATGADTGNITSSAYITVRNAVNAPSQIGTNQVRKSGTAISHPGGNVSVGSMVVFALSAGIDGNNNNQVPSVSCPGVSLTLAVFRSTSATSRAIHTYIWTGIATQSVVGPFSATASNPLNWTLSAIRVPG